MMYSDVEIDSLTGRYVAADLIPIKTEKGSEESLFIFGSRQIDPEEGCPVYLGAAQTSTEGVSVIILLAPDFIPRAQGI